MDALSQGLRGAIIAGPGAQLYVADYSAIEARVVMWLAGQEDALDIFRRGEDIYLDMATTIYHRVCTKSDAQERQLGKATILGCGFQMGASRFVDTAALYGITIDEDFSKGVVDAYRNKYPKVKTLWYDMEQTAVDALHRDNEGIPVECGKVEWLLDGRFLYCVLPSGRRLAYPNPQLTPRKTPWGETRMQLSFMGVDMHTHQWTRQSTYGGKLVENVTQAVARDVLAEALTRLEATGRYRPVLSVHDEIIAESSSKQSSVAAYEAIVTKNPGWADGLPIAAEAWHGTRYRK
jgi:DNA polymerase